jgi:hypothetical protein
MPPRTTIEAFSITHAQVMDGATAFRALTTSAASDDLDIYGVDQGNVDPDVGEATNPGDDVELGYWSWINHATINVRAGYMSFPLLSTLTGAPISSSGSGASILYDIDLWSETGVNLPPKPLLLRMPSKDKDGAVRTFDIGLYKVTFQPVTFDGPQYKEGLKVSYRGRATYSANDETGTPFPDGKKRIARLVSRAAI